MANQGDTGMANEDDASKPLGDLKRFVTDSTPPLSDGTLPEKPQAHTEAEEEWDMLVHGARYTPSDAMADVIGGREALTRTRIVAMLWEYIDQRKLLNQAGIIQADDKLLTLFGGMAKVDSMNLSTHINGNISKFKDDTEDVGSEEQETL